jgi:lipopolysaccharide/colanic/teichoic acid biosynthesis glycosyltransferase
MNKIVNHVSQAGKVEAEMKAVIDAFKKVTWDSRGAAQMFGIACKAQVHEIGPLSRAFRPRLSSRDDHRELLAQDVFRSVLCCERKRSARSHRSVLLMLIDARRIHQANQGKGVLPEIWSALSGSTRESDIGGWYQENAVLGVIFTEIGEADRNSLQNLMHSKVTAVLRAKLSAEQVNQICFSFHFFPKEWQASKPGGLVDSKLYPDLLEREDARKLPHFAKRGMDIVGSIIALLLFSHLFVVITLAIKLTSKGPILFKQERVGRYGVAFTFLKFRSMKCENDPSIHREYVKRFIAGELDSAQSDRGQNVVYKIQKDPRVTRVGKFLRRTSLDELPQLINVLKGEMSLVGPRPPIPYEIDSYQPWHWGRVVEVKPGITGLWQVDGRSRTTFDDMVRLDLRYARMWSLWLDLKILLQTPRAVFFGGGAY